MGRFVKVCLPVFFLLAASTAGAVDYYVDSVDGSDGYNGTSPSTAL